jgi:glycosyltransferase involved in cell wall biosynthesis
VRYDWVNVDSDLNWLTSAFDAVIVQRTALDSRTADELIERSRGKCALIVELDDFLLSSDPGRGFSNDRSQALSELLREARLVIVSTEELKRRLAHLNDHILVSPNALRERLWFAPLPDTAADAATELITSSGRADAGEIRAIYMGTYTHENDLEILKDVVAEVRVTYPNFRFFTVGITKDPGSWHESLPIAKRDYPRFVRWFRRIAKLMDFAVAPLVETDFNRAKSAIKLLEYSAAGLPVIASNVSPYREEIENGVTGLLAANNSSAWTAALCYACENPEKMRAMAERQRARVLSSHLLSDEIPKFDAAVLNVIETFRRTSHAATRSDAGAKT